MSKPRIMLVEDEKVVAADIEECVKGLGYDVVGAAATGTEALRLAVKTSPHLVLMDIKLRGPLDGIEVAGALYDQLRIPVVYLTAHADAEIIERAKQTAPCGYVLKPFDDRTLRTAIEMAFDRHRREQQLVESGQRLAAAIGNIDEGVIVTRETGQIAVMNRVAEMLTGWQQEEALGKPLGDVFTLLNGHTGAPLISPVGTVFREGISIGLGERVLLLSRKGVRSFIQGSAMPVRNGETQTIGVCLLFRAADQRSADEPWGSAAHSAASRMQLLGRLAASVAQKITVLLKAGRGKAHAARLADRLLQFGQRQPAPPAAMDLNQLIDGLDDLLQCALGDEIRLQLAPAPGGCMAVCDAGDIELLLIHLALFARESGMPGLFSITTAMGTAEDGDAYACISVKPPACTAEAEAELPALDEIIRQAAGEIRHSTSADEVKFFMPGVN